MQVGRWKEQSASEAVGLKRELDEQFYVYGRLLGDDVFHAFQRLINTVFDTYQGHGKDAKLRLSANTYERLIKGWSPDDFARFSSNSVEPDEIKRAYDALVILLAQGVGVESHGARPGIRA